MKKYLGLLVLYYLRFFARLQLKKIKLLQKIKHQPFHIVGITGSAGKTSCLLACETALKSHFRIKTNYGGNSESGIPLSILNLKLNTFSLLSWLKVILLSPIKLLTDWRSYDIFLVEMGIDSASSPKNMSYLLTILVPDIAIFLNITPVHLENFPSLISIAQEKALILQKATHAIINTRDPLVKKHSQSQGEIIKINPVNIAIPGYLLPPIYDITFGAVIRLCQVLKVNRDNAIESLQGDFHLPPSRSSILPGIKNSTIIDSTYNSSPLACIEMLNLLSLQKPPRIAILGDMRELGPATASEHQKIYQHALLSSDQIISIGPLTKKYFGDQSIKFLYWWQALKYIKANLKPKSTFLIKGSQNTIFLEEIVKKLLTDPKDSEKICRQTPYWLKLKNHFRRLAKL